MEYLKFTCYTALSIACIVYIFFVFSDREEEFYFHLDSQVKELQAEVSEIKHSLLRSRG